MLLRGRMDVRVRGPPIVRWMAPKDRLEPGNDLRHRLGLFWSTGVLLRQPDVSPFQSRCERIGFDCPWPEMGLPCAKKIGMDKTPRARLDQSPTGDARRQSIAGDSAVGAE